jgi:hypothetical protein
MTDAISRRSLLAFGGATVGGAVLGGTALGPPAGAAPVAYAPAPGEPTIRSAGDPNPGIVAAVAPALNPNWSYRTIGYPEFGPRGSELTLGSPQGLYATVDMSVAAPLALPTLSVIREVTFFVYNTSSNTGLSVGLGHITPPATFTGGNFAFTEANAGSHTVTLTSFLNPVVDGTLRSYALHAFLAAGAQFGIQGARVAWTNGLAYAAVTPSVRKLDTRNPGPLTGKIHSGQQKTFDLTPQLPAGAKQALLGLTVTDTEAAGFLGLFRGGGTWPGTSNINWFASGQTVSNTVTVPVSPTGRVTMRCQGPGATHVVVDLLGYYA